MVGTKMSVVDNIKILFVRGYIFLAVFFLSGLVGIVRTIIYGAPGSILTDPNDPRIGNGYWYMPPESYDKFYHTYRLINSIAFWSGIIGVGLYLWWKKRSGGEVCEDLD